MWTASVFEQHWLARNSVVGTQNRNHVFLNGHKLAMRRPLPRVAQAVHNSALSKVISNFSPHDTLGIDQNAGLKEIKRAFRKMALKHHPDREGGSEENFLLVIEAYEILTGKNPGKTADSSDAWEYHDWFWKFAGNRRKAKLSGSGWSQTQMKSQLAGLRHRAAVRATKEQQKSCSAAEEVTEVTNLSSADLDHSVEDFVDSAEAPADSAGSSVRHDIVDGCQSRSKADTKRRVALNGSGGRTSVTNQLAGLRRKAIISRESDASPEWGHV